MTFRLTKDTLANDRPIVILTGAGISSESGLDTFRDVGGVWQRHRLEDVATPEGFRTNPQNVHDFYNQRRRELYRSDVAPNPAHSALAALQQTWPNLCYIVTQNVDNLHERGGSTQVHHMHGSLESVWCPRCDQRRAWRDETSTQTICPACHQRGTIRPDIVWFGEMPYGMKTIHEHLHHCALFVAIGTAGEVYPAAQFWDLTPSDCLRVEVNIAPTTISAFVDVVLTGPASEQVPVLVKELSRYTMEDKS